MTRVCRRLLKTDALTAIAKGSSRTVEMMYQIVLALTVFAHFVFIGYVVVGGFLALRWRRTIWLHVVAGAGDCRRGRTCWMHHLPDWSAGPKPGRDAAAGIQ